MVQGNFFMFLQIPQNKKLNTQVLSVTSGISKNHGHEDLFLRKCAALVASFLNMEYNIWLSEQAMPLITEIPENTCLKLGVGFLNLHQHKVMHI